MCRAKNDPECPGGRRCPGRETWRVNHEGHDTFEPDTEQEREMKRPEDLLSMTPVAIRQRRKRAKDKRAEVAAMRTIHGLDEDVPIGFALRRELWETRRAGNQLSLIALADRFRAIAEEENTTAEMVGARYQEQRGSDAEMQAGTRLQALVMEDSSRPDWCNPDYLVEGGLGNSTNGEPALAYLRTVLDLEGQEWVLVTSHDGSEPMAFPHTDVGRGYAMEQVKERIEAAVRLGIDPDEQDAGSHEHDESVRPYTQHMTTDDFLAVHDSVHLV